jgi:Flp pilus assembly protein TadG
MKLVRDESGQVMALTLVCMFVLLSCLALAVDVGMLFNAKRKVQIAADAAAIAGALELDYHGATNVTTAANNAALANGITDTNQVTVNIGPKSGYHLGTGYVEVLINQPNAGYFSNLFRSGMIGVGARAVAGIVPSQICAYALDPTNANSFVVKGNTTVTAPNCGIQVNSSDPGAFCDQGSATVDAPYISIVGGQGGGKTKCSKAPLGGAPVFTGANPVKDPINLTGPNPATDCTTGAGGNTVPDAIVTSSTAIPSTPAKDLIPSDAVTCFNNASGPTTLQGPLTLGPGIYVFQNGVTLTGNVIVNGGTLDIYQGTFDSGNSNLSITAPTSSGTYNGIGIMMPSSNTTGQCQDSSIKNKINTSTCLQVQFGSGSNQTLDGIIYAPSATVYMQDQGGSTQAGTIVANDIYVNSQLTLTDNYSHYNPSTTPLKNVELVE